MKADKSLTSPTGCPENDRVSLPQKMVYSCGVMSDGIGVHAIGQLANPVYNIMLGVNPAWLGVMQGIARIYDAFTDPIMGHISDNFKSRWGRRKPFLAIGTVLMTVFFLGLWMIPNGLSEIGYFIYFATFTSLFYTAHTVFMVPYVAIGYQMTPDYNERTRVMAMRAVFQQLTFILVPWILAIAYIDAFGDPRSGIRWVSTVVAFIILATGLIAAFGIKERNLGHSKSTQTPLPLVKSFKLAFQNRPFVIKMVAYLFHFVGGIIPSTLGFYVLAYYVCGGDIKTAAYWAGVNGTLTPLIGIASVPMVSAFALKFGKKKAFLAGSIILIPAGLASWFCAVPGVAWLWLLPAPLYGLSNSFLSVLNSAIVADICDYDETRTGFRREAVFGSVNSWVSKSGVSVALVFSGFILTGTGFDADLGATQESWTLTSMRLWMSAAVILKGALAFATFWFFSLTPERMREIRAELEHGVRISQ